MRRWGSRAGVRSGADAGEAGTAPGGVRSSDPYPQKTEGQAAKNSGDGGGNFPHRVGGP
jgi:hypothetical protein